MLKDQVAIVTGGSRGLGRAFALALGKSGMRVAVVSRSAAELEETVELLRGGGIEAIAVPTDVTAVDSVHEMVANVTQKLGPADLLVNGAGLGVPIGPTWEVDTEEWWRTFEVNVRGVMLCCSAVMKGMIARRRGRIINIASGTGTASFPYISAYSSSKAGVIRFTEVLADEAREFGVAVFAIQPGTVKTAMADQYLYSEAGRKFLGWFQKLAAENRFVTSKPGEDLILYLASGQADELSGRLFVAPGAPGNLIGRTEEILREELNVMRVPREAWKKR